MDRGAWQAIVHGVVRVVTIKVFDAFQYWIICISEVSEMSDSLWPHGLWSTRVLYPWNSSGKTTGVGCPFLLQGIFPIQGLNPCLLHCRQILYCLSHQGSPSISEPCYTSLFSVFSVSFSTSLYSLESRYLEHFLLYSPWRLKELHTTEWLILF